MTIPQNVKDAVASLNAFAGNDGFPFEDEVRNVAIIRAHLMSQEAEISELRQGYWDARAVMGFDNGGDPTPRAVTSSFAAMMKADAKSMRRDYDESLRESDVAESRLAAANALLRKIGKMADETLCDEVRDYLQGAGDEA